MSNNERHTSPVQSSPQLILSLQEYVSANCHSYCEILPFHHKIQGFLAQAVQRTDNALRRNHGDQQPSQHVNKH